MHTQTSTHGAWYKWGLAVLLVPFAAFVSCNLTELPKESETAESNGGPVAGLKQEASLDGDQIEDAIQRISVLTQQAVQSAPPDYDKLLEAGEIAESLRPHFGELDPNAMPLISQAFYNQACGYSIKKDLDKAFVALNESITLGFEDKKLMENDTDLDNLRGDKRYDEALERFELLAKEMLEKKIESYFAATSPFPFDFTLESVEGKTVSLKELQGSKVTIVDFWGTWCPPCRMEIPHFVALHKKYGEQGLQIIGINYERIEKEESITRIKEYSEDSGIAYPLVLGDDVTLNKVPDFRGYPTTLFLDGKGVVRALTVGYVSEEVLEGIIKRIMEKSGS
jgi:thiol-disulfide isomerase/thioredoxin